MAVATAFKEDQGKRKEIKIPRLIYVSRYLPIDLTFIRYDLSKGNSQKKILK